MLIITYHQGNANQHYNDLTLHLSEWLKPKTQETTGIGKYVEKGEPSCTVCGNVNWCRWPLWKTVWKFLKKFKNRTTP